MVSLGLQGSADEIGEIAHPLPAGGIGPGNGPGRGRDDAVAHVGGEDADVPVRPEPAEIMPPMIANRFFTGGFISRSISSRVSARAYFGRDVDADATIRLRSPLGSGARSSRM